MVACRCRLHAPRSLQDEAVMRIKGLIVLATMLVSVFAHSQTQPQQQRPLPSLEASFDSQSAANCPAPCDVNAVLAGNTLFIVQTRVDQPGNVLRAFARDPDFPDAPWYARSQYTVPFPCFSPPPN